LIIRALGRVVVVTPECIDDSLKIEQKITDITNAGYRVEKKKCGDLVITDPSLRFKWESAEIIADIKKLLK